MAISGSAAKEAKYSPIGTGSIQAEEVTAVDGNAQCSAQDTYSAPTAELTVSGASSGKVYYQGFPENQEPLYRSESPCY